MDKKYVNGYFISTNVYVPIVNFLHHLSYQEPFPTTQQMHKEIIDEQTAAHISGGVALGGVKWCKA
eukprot:6112628-Ditylum_brightwellii.AAC.1